MLDSYNNITNQYSNYNRNWYLYLTFYTHKIKLSEMTRTHKKQKINKDNRNFISPFLVLTPVPMEKGLVVLNNSFGGTQYLNSVSFIYKK